MMKFIGIIPARYASTRFPGKPLADICGKPMIWWVYNKVKESKFLEQVIVALDDYRIAEICDKFNIPYILTKDNHPEHISRIHEVSEKITSEFYVCVNGDEPLISSKCIDEVLRSVKESDYFVGARRKLLDHAETIDSVTIKVEISENDRCIYLSRTPIPFPKGTLLFKYYKYVGIECFSKLALDFFVKTRQGVLEKIEDIDHLRFLENGKVLKFIEVDSESISVDTYKDLEKVRKIIISNSNEQH